MGADYARIVRQHSNLRSLGVLGTRFTAMAGPGTDIDDIPEMLLAAIHQLEESLARVAPDAAPRVADLLDDALERIEHPEDTPVIATGLPDLDDAYPGHAPGQLIILGARPAVGKSVIGLTFARHAAATGTPALFVSLEMTAPEIMQRLLAAESGQ
jgi:replicative DNA helicase